MGQVDSRVWVDGDGFVVAGLVQIEDGSVEEERRDGEAARRKELQHLKQLVSQYQDQLRTLEV